MKKLLQKLKPFPHISQIGMECGTTSLAIILKYYGMRNLQTALAEMAGVAIDGINAHTLIETARRFGFETEGYKVDFDHLQYVHLPCIAHYGGNHFIVLYKFNKTHVWVSDPAYGKRKLSIAEFSKKWNGVIINLEPGELLFKHKDVQDLLKAVREREQNIQEKFYLPAIRNNKKMLFEIVLATFLIQLLALAIPVFTQGIIDNVLVSRNVSLLYGILITMGLIFVLHLLLTYTKNMMVIQFKSRFENAFLSRFFHHFLRLHQSYFDAHKREDLIYRFNDKQKFRQVFDPNVAQTFIDFLFMLSYTGLFFYYNTTLALVATGLILLYVVNMLYFTPRIRELDYKTFEANQKSMGSFLDVLLGIQTVKLLGLEDEKFFSWKNTYIRSLNVAMDNDRLRVNLDTVLVGLYLFSQVSIYWLGAWFALKGELSLGQYVAFITVFLIVMQTMNNVAAIWAFLTGFSTTYHRINDVLLQPDEYGAQQASQSYSPKKDLFVRNLYFKYNSNQEDYVLKDINLHIKAGEKIGIVGRNGSGKSTLVKLLPQLYQNYSGEILLGQTPLSQISLRSLRKNIFLFPQDIYLFDSTIKENIACVKPEASIEEVVAAAKQADLHEFVKTLYFGYNHRVGGLGANLSGGQKLKVAFARLFLSNPDIIILDEASSALDVETEQKILHNLHRHFHDKTIISIAHRLNTLRVCDRILVMDQGTICEQGTHEELLQQQGLYTRFVNTYVGY